jgi:hypothetical protein
MTPRLFQPAQRVDHQLDDNGMSGGLRAHSNYLSPDELNALSLEQTSIRHPVIFLPRESPATWSRIGGPSRLAVPVVVAPSLHL